MRFTSAEPSTHHVTIPDHEHLRPGTLASVLRQVAEHQGMSKEELLHVLFE